MPEIRWRNPRCPALRRLTRLCGGQDHLVKELPDELAAMPVTELSHQRAVRDDKIAPLFQRWPALSRIELRQLRQLYAERLRIAKYLGSLQRRRGR